MTTSIRIDVSHGKMADDTEWHVAAQAYLNRVCAAEYAASRAAHVKAGRKATTHRYCPSDYVNQLVVLMGQNNENDFKALKGLQGCASPVGV